DPTRNVGIDATQRRFPVTRTFDCQKREAALHPRIAIQRDVLLLIAVHARHHDDSRYFATWLVAWRQMKDGRKLLAAVRDLCPFTLMVGKLHEFREGLPLLRVVAVDTVVDLIDRPHRRCPVLCGNKIIVTRLEELAVLL